MTLKRDLYRALYANYQAKKDKALFQLNLSFENPVAVGEHPQLVDDCIKLVDDISAADESLETLASYYGDMDDSA
jgi:hypothetical protein|tara:strand:- start:31 stop:255 length:225 start_codon:yes stop_codon:yes gene_type:complete